MKFHHQNMVSTHLPTCQHNLFFADVALFRSSQKNIIDDMDVLRYLGMVSDPPVKWSLGFFVPREAFVSYTFHF
jgi:hypothetical protein